jgi:hypothetical protein
MATFCDLPLSKYFPFQFPAYSLPCTYCNFQSRRYSTNRGQGGHSAPGGRGGQTGRGISASRGAPTRRNQGGQSGPGGRSDQAGGSASGGLGPILAKELKTGERYNLGCSRRSYTSNSHHIWIVVARPARLRARRLFDEYLSGLSLRGQNLARPHYDAVVAAKKTTAAMLRIMRLES